MLHTLTKMVLAASLVACAAEEPPPGDDPGDGMGDGTGGGGGMGSGGGTGSGGSTPATATAFLTDLSKAECDKSFACKADWPTEYGDFTEEFGADVNACIALGLEYYDAALIEASVTSGRVSFDATAAATCLSGLASATLACNAYWEDGFEYPSECDVVVAGKVAEGSMCDYDLECTGELLCGEAGTCVTDVAPEEDPQP